MKKIPLLTKPLTYTQLFFAVLAVVSARVLLEWVLFIFPVQLDITQDYIRYYLQTLYYFLNVSLIASLVVTRFTGIPLKEFMNALARSYVFILLTPVIDRALGRTDGYLCLLPENLFGNLLTLTLAGDGTPGMFLGLLCIVCTVAVHVYSRTRHAVKAFLSAVFLIIVSVGMMTPALFAGSTGGDYVFDRVLPLYYFLPFVILLILALFFRSRNTCAAIMSNLRPLYACLFLLLSVLGAAYVFGALGLIFIVESVLAACVTVLAWETGAIINDLADWRFDCVKKKARLLADKTVAPREYALAAVLMAFVAVSCAAVINPVIVVFLCVWFILAWVYAMPPLRLKNNLIGNLIIGLGAVLAFLTGVFSGVDPQAVSQIFTGDKAAFLLAFVFVAGFFFSMLEGIKDVEGDRWCGVRNLFTLLGKKRAKIVMVVIVLVVCNAPNLLMPNVYVYVISIVAAFFFARWERSWGVYCAALCVIGLTAYGALTVKEKPCRSCGGEKALRRRIVIDYVRKQMMEQDTVNR